MIDKRKSFLNVGVSIFFRIVILVGSLFLRRLLIREIGNEANGLSSLYTSIMGVLSVVELDLGHSITFAMYKPIVEKNEKEVAALYQLFRKAYWIIGAIITVAGICVIPVLPYLAKDFTETGIDLSTTFALMLISVVLSYLFSAKVALINAHKDSYITITIQSVCTVIQYVLQGVVLIFTGSFAGYLACGIVTALLQWMIVELFTNKHYRTIIKQPRQSMDSESKNTVQKNIKALFMHRIGGVLVNSADSLIISAFIGVEMLGKFSNYTSIATSMSAVISLIFTPLTAIIGHLFVVDKEETQKYFNFFYSLNYIVGVIFFLGYYAVSNSLIQILFGEGLEMAWIVPFIITLNYFVQFMRKATLLFRDATGTFYNDRWKPFAEGVLNVILSIALVIILGSAFGEEVGIVGVIVATIITNLTICHVVEPYVLFRYAFQKPVRLQLIKNYVLILLFIAVLLTMHKFLVVAENPIVALFLNGIMSGAFSGGVIIVIVLCDKDFRKYIVQFVGKKLTH